MTDNSDKSCLKDSFSPQKEEFTVEIIRNDKVEKSFKDDEIDFSELKKYFDNTEDERFI